MGAYGAPWKEIPNSGGYTRAGRMDGQDGGLRNISGRRRRFRGAPGLRRASHTLAITQRWADPYCLRPKVYTGFRVTQVQLHPQTCGSWGRAAARSQTGSGDQRRYFGPFSLSIAAHTSATAWPRVSAVPWRTAPPCTPIFGRMLHLHRPSLVSAMR